MITSWPILNEFQRKRRLLKRPRPPRKRLRPARGKKRAALADVKAGDRVVVHSMKHADKVMAAEIQLATAPTKSK